MSTTLHNTRGGVEKNFWGHLRNAHLGFTPHLRFTLWGVIIVVSQSVVPTAVSDPPNLSELPPMLLAYRCVDCGHESPSAAGFVITSEGFPADVPAGSLLCHHCYTTPALLRSGIRVYDETGALCWWLLRGVYEPDAALATIHAYAAGRGLPDVVEEHGLNSAYSPTGQSFARRPSFRYSRSYTLVMQHCGIDV